VLFLNFPEGTEGNHDKPVRITGIPIEIRNNTFRIEDRAITTLSRKAIELVAGFSQQAFEFDVKEDHVGRLGELMEHVRCGFLNQKNKLFHLTKTGVKKFAMLLKRAVGIYKSLIVTFWCSAR
jgi:hypothetical protein